MGFFYFGAQGHELEIDDRPLAHLKIALLSLLRAGKSVALTITRPVSQGGGRETLWISPSTDLRFRFIGGRAIAIDEAWVHAIIATADTPTGLRLCSPPTLTPAVAA